MDHQMIARAVEAAAKAGWEEIFPGEWSSRSERTLPEQRDYRDSVRPLVVAALNKVVGQLATERDYYRNLLEHHGKCICDTNPATTDGPDEFCPWHGRSYTEILEWGEKQAERAARVEGLCLAPVPRQDDPHRRSACLLPEGHTTAHSKPHSEVLDSLHRAQDERDRLRAGWCEHNKCPGNSVCCCQTGEIERMAEEMRQQRVAIARVEKLAQSWKYDGRFGYDDGSHAYGPDPEGIVLDDAAHELIKVLRGESE